MRRRGSSVVFLLLGLVFVLVPLLVYEQGFALVQIRTHRSFQRPVVVAVGVAVAVAVVVVVAVVLCLLLLCRGGLVAVLVVVVLVLGSGFLSRCPNVLRIVAVGASPFLVLLLLRRIAPAVFPLTSIQLSSIRPQPLLLW